ncbi:MAG TPA: ABC transporter permease [Pirellulales bacterium]|jgi:ABC-2 type transport system permease protein|nr:ABC transporter permease [Pirellulales bacterium]
MRKIAIIARREYQALVRTKAFIISLVIMPVFMFGGIFLQKYLSGRIDIGEKKVIVLDGTDRLFAPLSAMARLRNETEVVDKETGRATRPTITLEQGPAGPVTDATRLGLSERIHRNEIFAFVEIDADALKPAANSLLMKMLAASAANNQATPSGADAPPKGSKAKLDSPDRPAPVRVFMESIAYNEVGQWLTRAVNQVAFALRLQDAGLNPAVVAGAVSPVNVEELGLYSRDASGQIHKGDGGERGLSLFLPFGLMMLLFLSVMVAGQPMISSVLEEKQQRIAEVLLGSASPFQIMMGKLVGNVGVALTIVALYMTGGYFMAAHYGYADLLPMRLVGWFIAFDILACMLYGAIFIAIGAACTEIKETQSLLTPVMLLIVSPLMVWFTIVQEPQSSFAVWTSLFPPATPMLMLLRMAASPMVPWWQPVLGIVLVLAATIAAVFAAGRVFRIGLLIQGKSPKLRELMSWIVRG